MTTLDQQLLSAHAEGDAYSLVALYDQASQETDDETAAGFYLTHAYVFALELGHPDAAKLRKRLVDQGRE
ncbi:MAG: hypothetical protein WBC93_23465 [Sulfitobacter sp.]